MMALLKKNMVVIGIVVVALGALFYFYSSGGSAPLLSSDEANGSPVSQEILATLGNLRTIKLDNSVFSDPLFVSLSDFGVTIPPAAAGRRNPFAPVGSSGSTPPASTGTTTGSSTSAR
ncbi:MAG: hypothetical protein JWL87_178 [Candidatus Adlerbacteria bacterium]|nr:hypothetical protein [Candidatus Adlerbacteria bacterium]